MEKKNSGNYTDIHVLVCNQLNNSKSQLIKLVKTH